jgi:aryl-alcohol dehydrogenase-like predicted oxidoreductase
MNLTHTAFGTWSGGKFMHFGEMIDDERMKRLIWQAFDQGVRTFVTADVYGAGRADLMLGEALKGLPREEYSLVGMIGHDFYEGLRAGSKGYPRFTDKGLRDETGYDAYVEMAVREMLKRCGAESFDLLMLHNPDRVGYTSDAVWSAMSGAKHRGLTERLGVAPGPANGFTLDMIDCFEKYGEVLDWAMVISNPFEPWPSQYLMKVAERFKIDLMARVVDYGGIFYDDVKPQHYFRDGDHRTYRPAGWIEAANVKLEKIRPIAERHGLTMIQLASVWTLAQGPVKTVAPTLIQEAGEGARTIESKLDELSKVPQGVVLTAEDIALIHEIGNNEGCMTLKGASARHAGQEERADEWPIDEELLAVAGRWQLGDRW